MSAKTKHLSSIQVAQPRVSTDRKVLGNQVGATANETQRRPRYQAHRRLMRWDVYLLFLGAIAVTMLLGSAIIKELATPRGILTAAQTSYNFGDVPIGGGDITTRFPLTVQGDARAVDITTT